MKDSKCGFCCTLVPPRCKNKDCPCHKNINSMEHLLQEAKEKIRDIIEHPLFEYHTTEGHEFPKRCVEEDVAIITELAMSLYAQGKKEGVEEIIEKIKEICNRCKTERGLSVAIGNYLFSLNK